MAIQFELYKTPRPKDEADKETYKSGKTRRAA